MNKRVLSVHTYVVCGYVGNNATTLCLQLHGFEVNTINSITYSNHPGYGMWKGKELKPRDMVNLIDGLDDINLLYYTHILTGYIPTAELLLETCKLVKRLRQINPELVYVCDPVIGDNDMCYAPKDQIPIYKEEALRLATVITPNQFEAECLTGIKLNSKESVERCIRRLHELGPQVVVVTSVEDAPREDGVVMMTCYASHFDGRDNQMHEVRFRKVEGYFVGTGDVFSALILARMERHGKDLKRAVEETVAVMQVIISKTCSKMNRLKDESSLHDSFKIELAILDCMDEIRG